MIINLMIDLEGETVIPSGYNKKKYQMHLIFYDAYFMTIKLFKYP